MAEIFGSSDYRDYLKRRLLEMPRGARQRFATHLGCQPSFISQVLNGKNDLSLEHSLTSNDFFGHGEHEQRYFMLMVLVSKSGTNELKNFYLKQLGEIHEDYLKIQTVVKKSKLEDKDVLFYFNNWLCISIHMLITIPGFSSPIDLRKKLNASVKDFDEAILFLQRTGLIKVKDDQISTGEAHIHLSKESPYAQSAVINTRLKILEKLKVSDPDSINYSSNFTISGKAHLELKQRVLDFVSDLDDLIDSEGPEKFCTLVLDLVEH